MPADSKWAAGSEMERLLKLQSEFDPSSKELGVVRVYLADQSHKYVAVTPATTGYTLLHAEHGCAHAPTVQQMVDLCCALNGISDAANYSLCTVSVVHGGLVKQSTLRPHMCNIPALIRFALASGIRSMFTRRPQPVRPLLPQEQHVR